MDRKNSHHGPQVSFVTFETTTISIFEIESGQISIIPKRELREFWGHFPY